MKNAKLTLRILLLLCLLATAAAFGYLVRPLLDGGSHTGGESLQRLTATASPRVQTTTLHYVTLTPSQPDTPHDRDNSYDIKHDSATLLSVSIGALLLGGMLFGLFYFLLERPKPGFNLKWGSVSTQHTRKHHLVYLLSVLSLAIFTAEFIIMLILPAGLAGAWAATLDASLLSLILLPLLYLLLIHPYFWQYHLRQRAETGNLLLANILDHANNEIYMFDTEQFRFQEVSQGACENLGYSREELSQMGPLDLKVDYTPDQYQVLVDPLLTGEKSQVTFETRQQRKDGTFYPVEVHLQLFDNISPPIFVAITEDISERKRYIAELEHKALYDNLTELPNRSLLMDRLSHAIKISRRSTAALSVLLIDILRLQEINDIMGHADGDLVLQQVARRLTMVLRESDTIARIGSDEFVIVLPNTEYEHLGGIAKKILGAFEELIYIREMPLEVEIAIGIALYPDHGDNPTTLLQHADVAMRISKRETSGFYLYTPEDDPFSVRHLRAGHAPKASSPPTILFPWWNAPA
jgi:diguanylate cyclase (GGDEF)-like protein/PAS domain S-box-containing protein